MRSAIIAAAQCRTIEKNKTMTKKYMKPAWEHQPVTLLDNSRQRVTAGDTRRDSVEFTALLGLIADIRAAVGDPTGKLMQDELVEHCRKLAHSADWNRRRVEMLSRLQKHMRDPERTMVCDILANGQMIPDPQSKRYGFAATGDEHL